MTGIAGICRSSAPYPLRWHRLPWEGPAQREKNRSQLYLSRGGQEEAALDKFLQGIHTIAMHIRMGFYW